MIGWVGFDRWTWRIGFVHWGRWDLDLAIGFLPQIKLTCWRLNLLINVFPRLFSLFFIFVIPVDRIPQEYVLPYDIFLVIIHPSRSRSSNWILTTNKTHLLAVESSYQCLPTLVFSVLYFCNPCGQDSTGICAPAPSLWHFSCNHPSFCSSRIVKKVSKHTFPLLVSSRVRRETWDGKSYGTYSNKIPLTIFQFTRRREVGSGKREAWSSMEPQPKWLKKKETIIDLTYIRFDFNIRLCTEEKWLYQVIQNIGRAEFRRDK